MYRVFLRDWLKDNPEWPDGLEPCAGEKQYIASFDSEIEAQACCKKYNSTHDKGRYSRKAEYE